MAELFSWRAAQGAFAISLLLASLAWLLHCGSHQGCHAATTHEIFQRSLYFWYKKSATSVMEDPLSKERMDSNPRHQEFREDQKMNLMMITKEAIHKLDAKMDDPNVLNVHFVPHTHDDVGWLKTVDEYYYGLNMTIQQACVRDILDSVVVSLLKNPSRTFTYVEQKFFSMWWQEQSQEIKASVHTLIDNKQLSFVNGGWCMHDEATTHYMGMIDQTTLGHQFLQRELGVIPKVGWQLDPFGHSATQASLLTAKAGMDALYFGRVDYQDLKIRHETQECEGLWAPAPQSSLLSQESLSAAGTKTNTKEEDAIFWGLTGEYGGQYECPKGFCFDVTCHDKMLVDMNRTELVESITEFVKLLKVQSDRTKGNHIMITQGGDFTVRLSGCSSKEAGSLFGPRGTMCLHHSPIFISFQNNTNYYSIDLRMNSLQTMTC